MKWQAVLVVSILVGVGILRPEQLVAAGPRDKGVVPGRFIVVVNQGESTSQVAARHGAVPDFVYRTVITGFAGELNPGQVGRLQRDPSVVAVVPDRRVEATPFDDHGSPNQGVLQVPAAVPSGVDRIDAEEAEPGSRPTHVAVLDTGSGPHPDLNVTAWYGCVIFACIPGPFYDDNGHGTHVAGTLAGETFGVARGLDIYSMKVLDSNGFGFWSSIIAGLDTVTFLRWIEGGQWVVNMSLSGFGIDSGDCGWVWFVLLDPLHEAICNATRAGIVVVVAAGNDDSDAKLSVPAAYDEVITVSALADYDGKGGHLFTGVDCSGNSSLPRGKDDEAASFSNFGKDVDIAAPGVCITSAWLNGGTRTISGTSMATPHVAGAVALLMSQGELRVWPDDSAEDSRNTAMRALGRLPQDDTAPYEPCSFSETKDKFEEPVLHVGPGNCD